MNSKAWSAPQAYYACGAVRPLARRSSFFADFSKLGGMYSLKDAYSSEIKITKFLANIKYEEDLRDFACGAVRPQAFVFLANFYEMADLSGKRHAYS